MTIALPIPYDDEMLTSVIARYISSIGIEGWWRIVELMFGRSSFPKCDVYRLDILAEETFLAWKLRPLQIAHRYTLYPYFNTFLTMEERLFADGIVNGTVESPLRGKSAIPGLRNTSVINRSEIRFCDECAAEDIRHVGEAYWRRSAQLPGIFMCVKHMRILRSVAFDLVAPSKSAPPLKTANDVIMERLYVSRPDINKLVKNENIINIAIGSANTLENTDIILPTSPKHYFSLARDLGLVTRGRIIDRRFICDAMISMYGQNYLNEIGLSFTNRYGWPFKMMRHQVWYHPLQHLLLTYFFKKLPEQSSVPVHVPLQCMHVTCPNSYASHGPMHEVERVKIRGSAEKEALSLATCSCGLKFAFSHYRDSPTELSRIKIRCFGKELTEAAINMWRTGMSRAEIAKAMGLSITNVRSMLTRAYDKFRGHVGKRDIQRWRRQWNTLLTTTAPSGHIAASKLNSRLYVRLQYYDKAWLAASAKKLGNRRGGRKVNWSDRDREWSSALLAAGTRLHESSSRRTRLTKHALATEAGTMGILTKRIAARLPLCRVTLSRILKAER